MTRTFTILGAAFALLAVLAGAFGVHGLTGRLSGADLAVWQTGAQYQMYHALGLLAVACLCERFKSWCVAGAGWLFVAGILLFSGSLYTLAVSEVFLGARQSWLGMVAPAGGLSFMLGWACLACAAWRK